MTPMPSPPARPTAADPSGLLLRWLLLPACLLLALGAYLPAILHAEFLNFDDPFYFGPDNALFAAATRAAQQGGVWAGLGVVLDPRQVVADVYLPVAHGSLWLDAYWFGNDPFGAHLVAVVLHGLAGYALFRWLSAMQLRPALAALAAFAFLLHPALCESVAWVSGRKDVLSGLFVFAALWATARSATRTTVPLLVGIAALGVLAMYSKATAVVQPLLALLVVCHRPGGRARFLAPLVLSAVTVPIAWHHQQIAVAQGTMLAAGVGERLLQVPGALAHYLATALWPAGLNVLYPEVKTLALFRAEVLARAVPVVLVLLAAILAWRRPALRAAGFGLFGFLLALLPYNTAWPASVIAVADRYLYLAVPFAAVAVAALLLLLVRKPVVVALLLVPPLLLATWSRAPAFADSRSLWTSSLAVDGDNAVALLNLIAAQSTGAVDLLAVRQLAERAAAASRYPEHERRARLLLAQYALVENRNEEAVQQTELAIAATERIAVAGRATPFAAQALLAQTLLLAIEPYRRLGRLDDAQRTYERAQALAADEPSVRAAGLLLAVDALAAELRAAGTPLADADPRAVAIERAVAAARTAVGSDARVECAAGVFARLRGRKLEAIACFRRAAQQQPDCSDAWVGAAEVCLEAESCDEAEEYARAGLAIARRAGRTPDPRLLLCKARALKGLGRLDEAIDSLRVYVESERRDRDAARLYSGLLMHKARARLSDPDCTHQELEQLIARALEHNPQEPAVDLVRARMLRDQRQFAAAVEALDRLRVALPDLEDTTAQLAENLRDLGYERLFAKDDDGAVAAWRRFVSLAPREIATDAVMLQLQAIWRRAEAEGLAAKAAGDRAGAERAFRRCLAADPDQHWGAWLLVALVCDDPAAELAELDRLSAQALAGQQRHGLDRSRQVAVRARVLGRLGQGAAARQLLDEYLAAPDADARPEVLAWLQRLRREADVK